MPCCMRSRLRNESVGAKWSPCWGPLDYCRWRAAYRRKRLALQRISRRGISSRATNSRSVRKKSPMSAWRRSMYSTRKLRSPPAFSSLEAAAADAVMAAAAEAEAAAAGDAAAAEAEAAAALEAAPDVEDVVAGAVACRGALAPSARACPEKACLWLRKAAEARYGKKGKDGERSKHASSTNNAQAVALPDWLAANGWKDEIFLDLDPQCAFARRRLLRAASAWCARHLAHCKLAVLIRFATYG